jgi:hypothetical protein
MPVTLGAPASSRRISWNFSQPAGKMPALQRLLQKFHSGWRGVIFWENDLNRRQLREQKFIAVTGFHSWLSPFLR